MKTLNYSENCYPIKKAEYNAIHNDYKGSRVIDNDHKIKSCFACFVPLCDHNGTTLVNVYFSDMPTNIMPS